MGQIVNFAHHLKNMKNLTLKDTFFSGKHSLNCRGKLLDLSTPAIMGILNITTDSFYDGGKYMDTKSIIDRVSQIVTHGADILDIGAMSTRPGSQSVDQKVEIERLSLALEIIRKAFPEIIISIDTFRPEVAKKMITDFDVNIINDIKAGGDDEKMFQVISDFKVPYIIMHMQGEPGTMQHNPVYDDVVDDILYYLANKTTSLRKYGINDIVIDPGFGFGKTMDHNYEIIANLSLFRSLELPILVGISRKSMISKLLQTVPDKTLNGTTALNMYALTQGASILRVHDVGEAVETRNLYCKIRDSAGE